MGNNNFTHITEEQRKVAVDLWNEFNAKLAENGIALFYDYSSGGFFVASSRFSGCPSDKPGALDGGELEQVIYEGGFGGDAVNNPPWFTSTVEYSLAETEA